MSYGVESKGRPDEGYVRSKSQTATIGNGGTDTGLVNFERPYAYYTISCENAGGIPAATDMELTVIFKGGTVPIALYTMNDPSLRWSKGALPESGAFGFPLYVAAFAIQIGIQLSNAVTADVVFIINGNDGAKA